MGDFVRIGAQGIKSSQNPLMSDEAGFQNMLNMICDLPGVATKRRGMKMLGNSSGAAGGYTSVFSVGTPANMVPRGIWQFDDHIWLYVEDPGSNASGICAYGMDTSSGWHKVAESTSRLVPDPSTNPNAVNPRKLRYASCDRRQLIGTATGVKRVAAIYDDYFPKGSTTNVNYSTMYRDAGVPRALDPRCRSAVAGGASDHGLIAATGFEWLLLSSAVAYRVAWYKRDENGIPNISMPSGRVVVRNTSTTTNYATRLKIIIPSGVTDSSYVLQIYRTNIISVDGAGVIPDPGDNHYLAGEYRLTSTDISNGYVLYEDVSFDPLLGAALYTNENQEGSLSGRMQPPICRDVSYFSNSSFFGDVTERQRIVIKLLAVDSSGIGTYKGITVGDKIVAGDLTMEAVTLANEEVQQWYFATDATTGAGSEVIRAMKTAESFVYKYNLFSNAKAGRYAAYNMTTNDDIVGVVMLEEKSIGGSTGAYVGVSRVDSPVQILPAPVFTSTPSNTLALAAAVVTNVGPTTVTVTTASNHNLTTNDLIFLSPFATSTENGTSAPRCANTDVPAGVYKVTVTGATTFTFTAPSGAASNQTDARAATTGAYIHKIFDTTTSVWTEARSKNSRKVNRIMWSPINEPESAPIINYVDLGAADKAVLRMVPTRDKMFIFKEDGVWMLDGIDGDWNILPLDGSVRLLGHDSVGQADTTVFALSSNGVYQITESGAENVSKDIIGYLSYYTSGLLDSSSGASACVHGDDNAYWLIISGVDQGGHVAFRYHIPTKTWTIHQFSDNTNTIANGVYSVGGITTVRTSRRSSVAGMWDSSQGYAERLCVAMTSAANSILLERTTGYSIDYCDPEVACTVNSFDTTNNTVTLAALPTMTEVGDVFLWYANALYCPGGYNPSESSSTGGKYRATITAINGTTLTLNISGTVPALSTWPAITGARSGAIMKQIQSYVQWMPFSDKAFRLMRFQEGTIMFQNRARFSSATITTGNDVVSGTSVVTGTATLNGMALTAWNSTLQYKSPSTAPRLTPIRFGIPQATATGSTLRVVATHSRAWESFDIVGIRIMTEEADNKTRRTNA